jgi:hypothetical protein
MSLKAIASERIMIRILSEAIAKLLPERREP